MQTAEFWILETAAAEYLGIDRSVLKKARTALKKDVDWSTPKNAISYNPTGFQRLQEKLGIPKKARVGFELIVAPKIQKDAATPIRLKVCRIYRNTRIVGATHPDFEGLVRIRTPRNRPFRNVRRGKVLKCRHIDADLFETLGRA